jgi:hypothetical protein
MWTKEQRQRALQLEREDAVVLAFWKSDKDGFPVNGGSAKESAHPGLVQTVPGPLTLCKQGTLHATFNPGKWKGDRLWIVALFGEVQFDDSKCGALKREILGEVLLSA